MDTMNPPSNTSASVQLTSLTEQEMLHSKDSFLRFQPHKDQDTGTHDPPHSAWTRKNSGIVPKCQEPYSSLPFASHVSQITTARELILDASCAVMERPPLSPNSTAIDMPTAMAEPTCRDFQMPLIWADAEVDNEPAVSPLIGRKTLSHLPEEEDEEDDHSLVLTRQWKPRLPSFASDITTVEMRKDEFESILIMKPMEEISVVTHSSIDFVDSDLDDDDTDETYDEDSDDEDDDEEDEEQEAIGADNKENSSLQRVLADEECLKQQSGAVLAVHHVPCYMFLPIGVNPSVDDNSSDHSLLLRYNGEDEAKDDVSAAFRRLSPAHTL